MSRPIGTTETASGPAAGEPVPARVLDAIRALRGVLQVVRLGEDGPPAEPQEAEAARLAETARQLLVTPAAAVTAAFGLGELGLATLRRERGSLAVVRWAGDHLAIAVAPEGSVEPVVGLVRALLARKAAL